MLMFLNVILGSANACVVSQVTVTFRKGLICFSCVVLGNMFTQFGLKGEIFS